jgi:ribose transport system substrate-binding protein
VRKPVTGKTYTIGVAQISTTIPFLAVLDDAVTAEATKLGMKTTILNANLQDTKQSSNIEDLIAKKVSVILVDGGTPTALNGAIKDANKAGIPVIAVNGALDTTGKLVTYEGDSDFDYGVGEGNLMVQALPKGGKIAIILGILGGAPEVNRLAGIKSVLAKHPEIKIVATPSDNFDNSRNLAATQDLLSKYPKGSIDGIMAEGPEMYVGAKYAATHGRGEIKFIAGDYSIQVRDAIKSGSIFGTVNQDPKLEGTLGADYAYDLLTGNGKSIPTPQALIPLPLVTKDNVDSSPTGWNA